MNEPAEHNGESVPMGGEPVRRTLDLMAALEDSLKVTTEPTPPMAAADVRERLLARWPASEYAAVYEAPQGADRQGRKLDVLFVSLWRSRGHDLDGVEVKVSVSDWRRELKEAAKADWWWRHVHRFWVAVPASISFTVRSELPSGWGLLTCNGAGTTVAVKPERHDPEPLPMTTIAGLLRASSGAGLNALQRRWDQGREQGFQEGQAHAERRSGDAYLRSQLDELQAKVEAFEEASGLTVRHTYSEQDAGRLGRLVKVLRHRDPDYMIRDLRSAADRLASLAADLAGAMEPDEAHITKLAEAGRMGPRNDS